ncbi:hypothetical protein [Rhizobium sp. C1]|uniref:hypothetical protein n=1 Tax=Rhizobium sp. C1 TaxID=1349799 RepID=UPI001E63DC21|nr:hypothetical protein [Rhizobium sp. C1]MCD2176713.1 hypothetical protein [Rhizobium sp. C1]
MKQLSICMPSNRGFETSFRAIETALAFCEARNAILIVSDNSRDVEKAAYWKGRSEHLLYVPDAPLEASANGLNSIKAVETPFLMPLGDDDELYSDDAHTPVDLATLGPDVIGVKPLIELFSPGTEMAARRAFALDGETAGLRLQQFLERNQGDNTSYYSVFRTAPYISLGEYFQASHPTRGLYCDWALAMALFMAGKLLFDPSIVFRYNASAWSTPALVEENARKFYTRVGLPGNFRDYNMLLRAMDLFVLCGRKGGGMAREALAELQTGALWEFLNYGFSAVLERANPETPNLVELAQKGLQELNPVLKFLHGAAVLDCFQPGLKAKYIAFLKSASV